MKILLAAMLLVFPAAAGAAPVIPPVGASVGGYALEATDSWTQLDLRSSNMSLPYDVANGVVRGPAGLQWGSAGCSAVNLPGGPVVGDCTLVPGMIATWRAQRFHRYRKTHPWLDVTAQRFYVTEGPEVIATRAVDVATVRLEYDTPDCNMTGDNPGWVVPWGPGPAGLGAGPDAPDDFAVACGLPRASGSGEPATGTPPAPPSDEKILATTCAAITYKKKRVAVTSTVACTSGRTIMARYLSRGIEPRGWVCVTAANGRSRAATCAVPAAARTTRAKRVTARWRA